MSGILIDSNGTNLLSSRNQAEALWNKECMYLSSLWQCVPPAPTACFIII